MNRRSDFRPRVPPSFNFAPDVLDRLAVQDRIGLIFIDPHGYRRDYRFAEITELSQRYAAVLRDLGVAPGERVMICLPQTAKAVFTMLALDRLGATIVLCDPALTAPELIARADQTRAATIIGNRANREELEKIRGAAELMRYVLIGESRDGWARLDTSAEQTIPFRGVITESTQDAFIVYPDSREESSPGVAFDRAHVYASHVFAEFFLDLKPTDIAWCTSGAPWNTLFAPWTCAAAVVLHHGEFEPNERLELIRELEVTVLCQPVTEYRAELEIENVARLRLPRLRRCAAIGSAADAELSERWQASFGLPLFFSKE